MGPTCSSRRYFSWTGVSGEPVVGTPPQAARLSTAAASTAATSRIGLVCRPHELRELRRWTDRKIVGRNDHGHRIAGWIVGQRHIVIGELEDDDRVVGWQGGRGHRREVDIEGGGKPLHRGRILKSPSRRL